MKDYFMKSIETIMDSDSKHLQSTLGNETEIMRLLQGLTLQYEEVMQLSDFADFVGSPQDCYPKYTWDNPIGLVITGSSDASLV